MYERYSPGASEYGRANHCDDADVMESRFVMVLHHLTKRKIHHAGTGRFRLPATYAC